MDLTGLDVVVIIETEANGKQYLLTFKDKEEKTVNAKDLTENELFIIELVNNISILKMIKEVALVETEMFKNIQYKIESTGVWDKNYSISISRGELNVI